MHSNNPKDYRPARHSKITYVILLPEYRDEEKFSEADSGILLPKHNDKTKQINERLGVVAVPSLNSDLKEGDVVAFSTNTMVSDIVKYDREYYMGFDADFRKLDFLYN